MQRFPDASGCSGRSIRRTRALFGSLAFAAALLAANAAWALDPARLETHRRALQAGAEPGAYCPLGGCRPAGASPWTAAAFGAAVVTIAVSARGREIRGL